MIETILLIVITLFGVVTSDGILGDSDKNVNQCTQCEVMK
jgi:hypothetical protein